MTFALGSRAQALSYRLVAFPEIGSTNAEAVTRARAGERGPLWLVTGHQTAGRGRRHRSWTSPPGNLAASVLEVMNVPAQVAATLGFAAGVALAEALASLNVSAQLKWPNDVLMRGAKLSGILLEAESIADEQLAVVVGIGVNIVSAPQGTPYRATCLRDVGSDLTAEAVFAALSDAWSDYRALWADGTGMAKLRDVWLKRAANLGGPITVNLGSKSISGTFETIDEQGYLIVKTAGGKRQLISSGDVFFGDAASAVAGGV
jgi:BirA family transcriptional regulator, biotin operon repressor / biotin---[acetyl-CoA-carboxylase] ligase